MPSHPWTEASRICSVNPPGMTSWKAASATCRRPSWALHRDGYRYQEMGRVLGIKPRTEKHAAGAAVLVERDL